MDPVAVSAIEGGELVGYLVHVLVAASAQREDVETGATGAFAQQPGDRVGGLERGDDPLESRELAERAQGLRIRGGLIGGPAGIPEEGVLGSHPRIVEPGRDRVGLLD